MKLYDSKTYHILIAKTKLEYLFYVIIGLVILSIILLSCVPPVSRDALTHHLALPKLYLQHGFFHEVPSMKFSYYPMNLELLYMIPMYFGNDVFPKIIHFSFAIATACLLFSYLKKRINKVYGLFGSLLFLTTPIIIKLSITAYVDLGLIFFSTASILYLMQWIENQFKLKYIIISGLFSGLALGTKYNGLIVFAILTLSVPLIYIRVYHQQKIVTTSDDNINKSQLQSLGYAGIFVLSALIVFSPWMVRNYIWKNNPIYPIYDKVINPVKNIKINPTQENNKFLKLINGVKDKTRWGHFSIRRLIYKESWLQISTIPLRIFFQGKDGDPKYFDGKLNPFLLILPFFIIINRKKDSLQKKRETSIFLFFSIVYVVYAFFAEDIRIRYIGPIIPPLVILSVYGVKKIIDSISKQYPAYRKKLIALLVTSSISFFMLINLSYMLEQFRYVDPLSFISGKVSRDEYITKYRPEYPVIKYANKNISEKSKILCLFLGNRRYYSDRDMVFNERLFLKTIKTSKTSESAVEKLRNKSITHIILWEKMFGQWARINFNDKELSILQVFFKNNANLIFMSGGYQIYKLDNVETGYN